MVMQGFFMNWLNERLNYAMFVSVKIGDIFLKGISHVASFLFFARIGGGVGHAAWVADGGNNPRISPSVEDTSTDW